MFPCEMLFFQQIWIYREVNEQILVMHECQIDVPGPFC